MCYLKRIITALMVFVFVSMISCTPSKVMTRDNGGKQDNMSYSQENKSDEYSFREDARDDKALNEDRRDFDSGKRYSYDAEKESSSRHPYDSQVNYSNEEKFYQKGLASWYGREFQGSITASGERFDMNKLTAAHKSLPFGTQIIVKNLENGQSVRVVVNDRGPYREGRILDLSHAAAQKLDMISKGEANVGLIIIGKNADDNLKNRDQVKPVTGNASEKDKNYYNEYDENDSVVNDDSNGNLSIQAGAFYSRRNAEKLKKQIEETTGNSATIIHEDYLYKVRVDGLNSRNEAEKCKKVLLKNDISSYIIENKE